MLENKEGVLDLESIARKNLRRINRNFTTPMLYEEIIKNREGDIAHLGPIVVRTGHYTERTHEDKFIVREPSCEDKIWYNKRNKSISQEHFNNLFYRLVAYMQNKVIYVQDCYSGHDPDYQIPIRIVTENAWHNLYARNMFVQISDAKKLDNFKPYFTVIHIPGFHAIPEIDGTKSSAFIIINMSQKVIFIGGTSYAGEIGQAISTISNYFLLQKQILTLHCSANIGENGDVAIFLGRMGTGKTTLATDVNRKLLGDNEHAWTDKGLLSLQWGCYPIILNLSREEEPLIYECTRKFGTILENVHIDNETKRVDFKDKRLTENIRAAYPVAHLPNSIRDGASGHPKNIFLLTCDAFGVMPPLARLTNEQAVYAFLSSYTSKFKGNESGPTEQKPVFSACFGASPLSLQPHEYAKMFMEKIKMHQSTCWLMNTGWCDGASDSGDRIKISYSRALINAVVNGKLDNVDFEVDPVFQFEIPKECPGVPEDILNPRNAAHDEGEYDVRANRLALEFMKDYSQFENEMPENIRLILSNVISLKDSMDLLDELNISM